MNLDLATTSIFVVAAVTGATELVNRLFAKDWKGAITITLAATIGALAGLMEIDGLTVPTGIVAGLAASGLVTVAQKFGGATTTNLMHRG